jgi:3-methyladenine DNA glycosylase Mpg
MGYKTRVQRIKRQKSEQWYINFPAVLAQAMEFSRSENVEWLISDKQHLILYRPEAPEDPINVKKNGQACSPRY